MDSSSITISGPLKSHVQGLWDHLLSRGYTPLSVANIARLMAHFSRWLAKRRISAQALSNEQIDSFFRHRRRLGYGHYRTRRALSPILDYLVGIGIVQLVDELKRETTPLEQLQADYNEYLLKERSVGGRTRKFYLKVAGEFLAHRVDEGHLHLLTGADLSAFILKKFESSSVQYCKHFVVALRSLVRYLFVRGKLSVDLSTAVPAVAGWRVSSLPKSFSASEVKSLLASCDRRTSQGRLSYALLLLMLRLGLRACEVAALRIEDIRWRQGEILIRGKGGREDNLPLPEDVGHALAAYLRRNRPCSEIRSVFVKTRAPRGPLGSGGVKRVVASACRKAGIAPAGAHRLRHTAATEMLRRGVPLPEIAQVLRHRHIDTTAVYAKVDRESLRTLAQPWPGGAA